MHSREGRNFMRPHNSSGLRVNGSSPRKLSSDAIFARSQPGEHRAINLCTRFARARKNAEKRDDAAADK